MPSACTQNSYFDAPEHDIADIESDDRQLRAITERIEQLRAEAAEQLARRGRDAAGVLQQYVQRDAELHQAARRLRQLDRMGAHACLGFMVDAATGERTYIGRLGLGDAQGEQLLVDWRAAAAEPFFAATHAGHSGLSMRRRYRWRRQRVVGYFDEVFELEPGQHAGHLDDYSAFLASLGERRTGRMNDVLSTLQADQDALIRSSSRGALVIDGGPGTGKTVVALHRAAYLLHADAQLRSRGGRILVVSPHDAYTEYVADILPNLGEDEVLVSTLSNIVSNDAPVIPEADPRLARIKSSLAMVEALHLSVGVFEQPPSTPVVVDSAYGQAVLGPEHFAAALAGREPQASHNDARGQVEELLIDQLAAQLAGPEADEAAVRRELGSNDSLGSILDDFWPVLDPGKLLRALYCTEALLGYCATGLDATDRRVLLDAAPRVEWSSEDLPLLDLARQLVGDPQRQAAERRNAAAREAERRALGESIGQLIAAADDREDLSSQLVHADLQEQLLEGWLRDPEPTDPFDEPFTHIIVDEAQDLSDAQWDMVKRRCPSGSLTIVGDRAQAAGGFAESWQQRLQRLGIEAVRVGSLRVNYRSTAQIMRASAATLHASLPGANVPVALREDGKPVRYADPGQLERILGRWLDENPQGIAAVIGAPGFPGGDRVFSLQVEQAKGLEFDLVLLVRTEQYGTDASAAVRRYVAMTRATAELVVLIKSAVPGIE